MKAYGHCINAGFVAANSRETRDIINPADGGVIHVMADATASRRCSEAVITAASRDGGKLLM